MAPFRQEDNQWSWAAGFGTQTSDHRPGPTLTEVCEFTRTASDPTTFAAHLTATVDGTFVGFGGGFGDYFVTPGNITVQTCPCQ